jgi:hypothetical protein
MQPAASLEHGELTCQAFPLGFGGCAWVVVAVVVVVGATVVVAGAGALPVVVVAAGAGGDGAGAGGDGAGAGAGEGAAPGTNGFGRADREKLPRLSRVTA